MSYLAIKHLHITFAMLSGSLFFIRGVSMLRGSSMMQGRRINVATYVIDTVLLTSAVTMMIWSSQYPLQQSWLTVKLVAIVAYIVAGTFALRRGKTRTVRSFAFITALLLFAYVIKLAVTRQVL